VTRQELRRCHRCDVKFPRDEPHFIDQFGYVCQRCITLDDIEGVPV
jgi:hypothetical protein